MPDSPIRVALDEAAFRQLCAGELVELRATHGKAVQFILSDIGLVPALQAVLDGMGAGFGGGVTVREKGRRE